MTKKQWIAIVQWKPKKDEKSGIEYSTKDAYGPFTTYDTGIKIWSARFSNLHQGKIESIDYHVLIKP